jgi:hypothetical protein
MMNYCICNNTLIFDRGTAVCECSECGRKWGKTSNGKPVQIGLPTKHETNWRVSAYRVGVTPIDSTFVESSTQNEKE